VDRRLTYLILGAVGRVKKRSYVNNHIRLY